MKYLKIAIVIITVLAVGLVIDNEVAAQSGRQSFSQIITKTLTVENAAEFQSAVTMDNNLSIAGNLDVTGGDTTLNGQLDVSGGQITLENDETIGNNTDGLIDFGGGLILNTTTITVTDGQTITPTVYSAYRLNAAGAVTITLAACSSDGQPLYLYGEDAQTITIADSDIRTSDGAAGSIGQYDLWVGMCFNAEWVEIANPANS